MAIDTREKRSNVQRVGRAWMRGVHPTGSIDEQERIAIGIAYGGNALSPGVVVSVYDFFYKTLLSGSDL